MRSLVKIGSIGLVVLGLSVLTANVRAGKNGSTEEQVAVLMKWYRTYFEQGKYKQAEQVAQLARELAPEDSEIIVALKLAQRQLATTTATEEVPAQLNRVLLKLDRVERQLREMESKNRQRLRIQMAKEPPGSPDAAY